MEKIPVIYIKCQHLVEFKNPISVATDDLTKTVEETVEIIRKMFSDYCDQNNGEVPRFIAVNDKEVSSISLRFNKMVSGIIESKLEMFDVRVELYSQFNDIRSIESRIRSEYCDFNLSCVPASFGTKGSYLLYVVAKS